MPIYAVKNKSTGEEKIIEATNRNVAINHAVKGDYEADILSASDIVARMKADDGLVVEHVESAKVAAEASTEDDKGEEK